MRIPGSPVYKLSDTCYNNCSSATFLYTLTKALVSIFTIRSCSIYDIYGKADKHRCGQVDINGAN